MSRAEKGERDRAWLKGEYIQKLREKFLGALYKGGGVRVSHRSVYFKFDERDAVLLLDQLSCAEYGISVGDKVAIDPMSLTKWGFLTASGEAQQDCLRMEGRVFRVVAFVELSGTVRGGMSCKGMFCVLAELLLTGIGESLETWDSQISCADEDREGSSTWTSGKVRLYPVEALRLTEDPPSRWVDSHVDQYTAELMFIGGVRK